MMLTLPIIKRPTRCERRRDWRWKEWCRDRHCRYCGITIARFRQSTVDHVVPTIRGGRDEPANWLLSCGWCNAFKSQRLPSEWAKRASAIALNAQRIAESVEFDVRCDPPPDGEEWSAVEILNAMSG